MGLGNQTEVCYPPQCWGRITPPASPLAMTVNVPEQCDMNTQIKDVSEQHMVANPRMSFFWLSMGGVTNLLASGGRGGREGIAFPFLMQ